MPNCPGCHQTVPYERLDAHLAYCGALVGGDDEREQDTIRRLDRHVAELDADVDRRLGALEEKVDRLLEMERRPPEVRPD